jgi:phenylacetate-coenzyme A ligase PaaK-like adenylate-forming protein
LHFSSSINPILDFSHHDIFSVTQDGFETLALKVFRFQYANVPVYHQFCDAIGCKSEQVKQLSQIPFLPISIFKTHQVLADGKQAEVVFESSGTTGMISSKHYVADTVPYEQSFSLTFQRFYGSIQEYVVLALLPSYIERGNSSLVYMTEKLIHNSNQLESGFYLHNQEELYAKLLELKVQKQRVLLLGVTYALLDFSEKYSLDFPELIVMETGGMKGRRKEMVRQEVHAQLTDAFGVAKIHSEYGMTELLSQAYSKGDGLFLSPPWMKIVLRDLYDPKQILAVEQVGAVNVIDLANIYSCAFIETSDIARVHRDETFEIIGRADQAELRGCNLMVS